MARVETVAKARKSPGKCEKCSCEILPGAGYRHYSPGFRGPKHIRCLTCPMPRASETTGNDKLRLCYEAGEAVEDGIDAFRKSQDIEDLRGALESAKEKVEEARDAYREAQENIEEGFQHSTQQSDELGEKADNLESKADEIGSAADDLEDFDEDNARSEAEENESCKLKPENMTDEDVYEEMTEEEANEYTKLGPGEPARKALIEKKRAELQAEWEKAVNEVVEEARGEWIEEQADKASEFTDISPD